jgi:hypothetical protein
MGRVSLRHNHGVDLMYRTFANGSDEPGMVILVYGFLGYALTAIRW